MIISRIILMFTALLKKGTTSFVFIVSPLGK